MHNYRLSAEMLPCIRWKPIKNKCDYISGFVLTLKKSCVYCASQHDVLLSKGISCNRSTWTFPPYKLVALVAASFFMLSNSYENASAIPMLGAANGALQ